MQAIKTGATGNNVAGYFSASGGANNYAIIVPSTGGAVGIGTVTPQGVFHIENGNARVITYDNDAPISPTRPAWAFGSQAGNWHLQSTTDYVAPFINRMVVLPTGHVGIGTTAPAALLHINPTYTVTSDTRSLQSGLVYNGASAMTNWYGHYIAAPTGTGTITNKYALVTEAGSGNVGIGTLTPSTKLELYSTSIDHLRLSSSNASTWSLTNFNAGYFGIRENANAPSLSILNGGNVGIGTVAPGNKLTVQTAAGADDVIPALGANGGKFALLNNGGLYGLLQGVLGTGNAFLQVQRVDATATAYNLLLQPTAGNVGIGTTTPGKKLEVNGDISLPSSGGNKQIYTWASTDANWRIGMSATPGFTRAMTTSHVEYMTFANGAAQGFALGDNVSGLSAFEVSGSGNSYNAYFRGNVGIATAAPAEKLHVTGNIRASSLAGTGTVLVQADANGTLSRVAGGVPGNMVLLHNNETSVSGFSYANTTAFTYNVVGTFSQVKVEADIENDCSGGSSVALQGWNYKIVYNGVTKRTAQLWCGDKNANDDWMSGHVSYMGAVANGQTVKIDVINTGTAGTWYVRNFRVYGIY